MPLIVLNVKSPMKRIDALYRYGTLIPSNDSRYGDSGRYASKIESALEMGIIGQVFSSVSDCAGSGF